MTTISSPLWSLFLATRRNSSSLIHIKLDKTSFLDGLSFSKGYWVHIFLFYFLFEIFPVLLLVLVLISCFNFILVWFNLGFLWSIVGGTSKQLGVPLKTSNRGKTKTIRTPCEINKSFHMGCENFAHHANQFRMLCENKPTMRNHFEHSTNYLQSMRKISQTQHRFTRCTKPQGVCQPI